MITHAITQNIQTDEICNNTQYQLFIDFQPLQYTIETNSARQRFAKRAEEVC